MGVCSLTAEQDAAVRFVCTNWLNYAALHGGTYEGEVCVALKGTEVYWLEQNFVEELCYFLQEAHKIG